MPELVTIAVAFHQCYKASTLRLTQVEVVQLYQKPKEEFWKYYLLNNYLLKKARRLKDWTN